MKRILTFAIFAFCAALFMVETASAQPKSNQQRLDIGMEKKVLSKSVDDEIFGKMKEAVGSVEGKTTADIMIAAAKFLLGTKYVSGTLEQIPERLIVNLHETDCILFAESCLGFAITMKSIRPTFENFRSNIQKLRYRDGIVNGYTSRIHYTSEWMKQAIKNKYVMDMSKPLCNAIAPNTFGFMSKNPDKYPALKNSKGNQAKIKRIETELNGETFYYIPKDRIASILPMLRSGDIVGFNTTTEGIDLSHVGIIYVENGRVGFIHASYTAKKVIMEPRTLLEYVNDIKSNNGIRIVRPM